MEVNWDDRHVTSTTHHPLTVIPTCGHEDVHIAKELEKGSRYTIIYSVSSQ